MGGTREIVFQAKGDGSLGFGGGYGYGKKVNRFVRFWKAVSVEPGALWDVCCDKREVSGVISKCVDVTGWMVSLLVQKGTLKKNQFGKKDLELQG